MRHPTANTIQRVFKMSFVPVGFWQRFIARMLISLAEMDLQVLRFLHRALFTCRPSTCGHALVGVGGGRYPLLEEPD